MTRSEWKRIEDEIEQVLITVIQFQSAVDHMEK